MISIVPLSSVLSLRKLIKISTSSGRERVVFVGAPRGRRRTLNVSLWSCQPARGEEEGVAWQAGSRRRKVHDDKLTNIRGTIAKQCMSGQ